jgi:hypothetical protein
MGVGLVEDLRSLVVPTWPLEVWMGADMASGGADSREVGVSLVEDLWHLVVRTWPL